MHFLKFLTSTALLLCCLGKQVAAEPYNALHSINFAAKAPRTNFSASYPPPSSHPRIPVGYNPQYAAPVISQPIPCPDPIFVTTPLFMSLYLSHLEGRGLGYKHGYSSLGIFLTPDFCLDAGLQPFFDIRGHCFNNGKYALNVGFGSRFICPNFGQVWGINVYYDYRRDRIDYNQIGAGIELLTYQVDFRLNGYFPIGTSSTFFDKTEFDFPGGFVAICGTRQKALRGFDTEIGTGLSKWWPNILGCWSNCPPSCFSLCDYFDVYGAIGAYGYQKDCHGHVTGFMGRLLFEICDFIAIEARYRHDSVFHTMWQGLISIAIPFGGAFNPCTPCCKDRCNYLRSLATDPVYRNEIIVVSKKSCDFKVNY